MSAMSDYLEEAFLNWLLGGTVYLGLAISTPFTDSAYASEASGGSYARATLASAFTVADAGGGQWQASNAAGVSFVEASGDWGEVVGWGIFDAAVAGNLLAHGSVDTPRTIYSGNTAHIEAGSLVFEAQ